MLKAFEVLKLISIVATMVLPIILVYRYQFLKNTRLRMWQVFIIGTVLVWLLIQVGVYFTDAHIQATLATFDLDNNGVFTTDEINDAQQAAMARMTSDTGRALAPITGTVFAFGYMSLLILFFKMIGLLKKNIVTKCSQY